MSFIFSLSERPVSPASIQQTVPPVSSTVAAAQSPTPANTNSPAAAAPVKPSQQPPQYNTATAPAFPPTSSLPNQFTSMQQPNQRFSQPVTTPTQAVTAGIRSPIMANPRWPLQGSGGGLTNIQQQQQANSQQFHPITAPTATSSTLNTDTVNSPGRQLLLQQHQMIYEVC